ncbi:MAG: hypothetical protein WC820_06225 [Spirochaetales bacterium]|jgi:vacuolar-type H+-ATPase subunit E/Vma4
MEEIKGTEALEREILDDASKKADRIVRKAREDADKLTQSSADSLDKKILEMEDRKKEKFSQMEKEILSKLPLEKTRLRVQFIDEALRASVRRFIDSIDDAELGAWCLSELNKRSRLFSGKQFAARYNGIDPSVVREMEAILGLSMTPAAGQELGASRRGVVIASLDGAMAMTLTEGVLEQRLLDEYRGELATALFPSAAGEDGRR